MAVARVPNTVYLPFRWVLSAMWLCNIGHFHSCCPSPVLNILLKIPQKFQYLITHVCIILVILHVSKMNYELKNIEQCYLPWANVICLGKWQITCTAAQKTDLITSCPVSVFFLLQLGEKMPWYLPFINKMPLPLTRHYVWMSVIYLYSIFTIFS